MGRSSPKLSAWTEAILAPIAAAFATTIVALRHPILDRPFLLFVTITVIAYRHGGPPAWTAWLLGIAVSLARPWIPGLPPVSAEAGLLNAAIVAGASGIVVLLLQRMRRLHHAYVARERGEADRFRLLMANSPEGVWRLGPDGVTLEVNRRMAELLGYEPAEMAGRPFLAFTSGSWLRVAEDAFERATRGEAMQLELMLLDRSGREVWTLVTTHPILDSDGRLVEAFGILRDITERHGVESERQEVNSLLEATLDSTTDGVLVVDTNGRIVRFNERFVRLWRLPDEVIRSRDDEQAIAFVLSQLVDPDAFVARVRRLYAKPEAESHDVLRFKDGRVFERFSIPQRLHGQVVGRVWTFRDVSDREQALAEQRLAAAREATIACNLDSALFTFVLGADERVERYEYFSLGAEGLFGIPIEELLRDPGFWSCRVHPEDFESVILPTFHGLLRLEPAMIEFRYESSKGLYRWHRARFSPRREADGLLHVDAIETDVTERVALEEQLRQAQKMEAVGQLAGGIAHDFNNILTAVLGYADLLLARLSESDPNRQAVEEIHKGGERAASLTRQLLAFSRRSLAQPRPVDLNEALHDLLPMLQRLAGEHIAFDLELESGLGRVRVDPAQLEQVIVNLVVNARDEMPGGGRVLIRTDRMVLSDGQAKSEPELSVGSYVRLRVADGGNGIDAAALDHIFEPFFTTKGPGRGTGLGLATVYGVVRQHRGRVRASNRAEGGAEFEILLPEADAAAPRPRAEIAPGPFPGGSETILWVEDDTTLLTLGREILAELGYTVLPAATGAEALRLVSERTMPIDLLVTDVVMPGMGGRELAARVTAMQPDLRVLYVSGYTKDSALLAGIADAAIAFLEKPYTPLSLARRVRETLAAPVEHRSIR